MAPAARDPGGVGLGHRRRAQVRDRVDGGGLVEPPVPSVAVEEGDRLLHVARRARRPAPVDQVARRLGADPVVLGPRSGHGHAARGRDVGGQVAHDVVAGHGPAPRRPGRTAPLGTGWRPMLAEQMRRARRIAPARSRRGRRRRAGPPLAGRARRVAPATKTLTVVWPSSRHDRCLTRRDTVRRTQRMCVRWVSALTRLRVTRSVVEPASSLHHGTRVFSPEERPGGDSSRKKSASPEREVRH